MTRYASRSDLQELQCLVKEPRQRELNNQVVLQGSKVVWEWLQAGKEVLAIFKTPEAPSFAADLEWIAKPEALASAIGLDHSALHYHVAIVEKPKQFIPSFIEDTIILDGLQDPGNVGTLMRSAMAFGFKNMILLEPCCDPYNEKVMRSSQGACVCLNLWKTDFSSFESLFEEQLKAGFNPLWVAHAKSQSSLCPETFASEAKRNPVWLVVGSEGRGPRAQLLKKGKVVHLSISELVESLNAAVAGSVLACYVFQARLSQSGLVS